MNEAELNKHTDFPPQQNRSFQMGEQEAEGEYKAVTSVLSSFYNFHTFETNQLVTPRIHKFAALSTEDQQLIPWYQQHTQYLEQCIEFNRSFCQTLSEKISQDWGIGDLPADWTNASEEQFNQTKTVLLQLMREWSDQGEQERQVGHELIISQLSDLYPDKSQRHSVKILIPGCGVGRLVCELVMQGFWSQGNSSDYHALFVSNFILNHCQFPHNYSIFPFLATSASNSTRRQNQIRPVTIPDVSPTAEIMSAVEKEKQKETTSELGHTRIPFDELMSITAGLFTDLYGSGSSGANSASQEIRSQSQGEFDVVVTEFSLNFLSTGIIDYIRTINNVLRDGGKWINFGPLLLENGSSGGLDLSRDDLFDLVTKLGFEFTAKQSDIETTYCGDIKLLNSTIYKCDFWVCRKTNNL